MDGNNFDKLTRKMASGMSRRSVVRGFVGGAAALVGMKTTGALAGPAQPREPQPKVDICHYDRDQDLYIWLNVNGNALSDTGHSLHENDFQRGTTSGCCNDSECLYEGICGEAFCNHVTGSCDVQATPGADCEDGNYCTVDDKCSDAVGVCNAGSDRDCGQADSTTCVTKFCNEGTDSCDSTTNTGASCGECLLCAADGSCSVDDPSCAPICEARELCVNVRGPHCDTDVCPSGSQPGNERGVAGVCCTNELGEDGNGLCCSNSCKDGVCQ